MRTPLNYWQISNNIMVLYCYIAIKPRKLCVSIKSASDFMAIDKLVLPITW